LGGRVEPVLLVHDERWTRSHEAEGETSDEEKLVTNAEDETDVIVEPQAAPRRIEPTFVDTDWRIAGDQLDDLFTTWLYTNGKPPGGPDGAPAAARSTTAKPKSYDQIERTVDLLSAAG
jgi:hypothetical protein